MSPAFRESLKIQVPLVVIFLVVACFHQLWALIVCGFLLIEAVLVACFFRDPSRAVPKDEKIIVAAADGLVVGIDEVSEDVFGIGTCKRVAIFLSVFDVHVNRMPVSGKIVKTEHKPGKHLDVRHPDTSRLNEALSWRIETSRGPVVVRQIAGLIARRIVAWAKENETLPRGARFGMIRFGSRTEIYLPRECKITVKIGDRVAGASSPIALWP